MSRQLRSIRQMLRSPMNIIVLAILLWFIVAFLIIPTVTLLTNTFIVDGEFSLRVVDRIASSDKAVASLKNSFLLAIILSVTVNITGIFIVLVTRYFSIRGAKLLWAGYATSLIYGGITLVAGYKTIYGANGYITKLIQQVDPSINANWFSGMFAVVFIMTFATTGNHMLFLSSSIAKLDYQTVEASRLMGASAWHTLIKVVLPTLKPMIFAITTLTFLGGLNALTAPLILGGEKFQTVAPMILTFAGSPRSRDLAAGLAVVLGIATLVLVLILNRLERRGQYFSVSKVPSAIKKQKITNPVANVIVHVAAYVLFIIYMIPPTMIVIFSFTNTRAIQTANIRLDSFTLENYTYALTNPAGYKPLLVSFVYATLAAVLVVVMITLAARIVHKFPNVITAAVEYMLHIPWVLPSILIALGLILSYSKPSPLVGGIILAGTSLILLFGYIAERIPFTFRLMKASFSGISDSLEEAAAMLGASNSYTMRRVLVPIVLPTALAVGALSFNSLLTEFEMSVFLSHPLLQPLGPFIRQATQGEVQRDTTALVFVYTVLLMIVAATTIWAVYGDHSKLKKRLSKKGLK